MLWVIGTGAIKKQEGEELGLRIRSSKVLLDIRKN